jgi:hypothetical protein
MLAAGAAGVGLSSPAQANLTISLQLAGGATSALIVGTAPIEIDVWAQITPNLPSTSYAPQSGDAFPGQAKDYGFDQAYYGVISTQVNPSGDVATSGGITSAALESWVNNTGLGATPGVVGDSNSDGAADVGDAPPETETGTNVSYALALTAPSSTAGSSGSIPAGDVKSLPGGGYEFLLEKEYYTPSATDATTLGRQITYSPETTGSAAGGAIWTEDGSPGVQGSPGTAQTGHILLPGPPTTNGKDTGNEVAGSSVLLYTPAVPEPATVSLLGLSALGLLTRRRKA